MVSRSCGSVEDLRFWVSTLENSVAKDDISCVEKKYGANEAYMDTSGKQKGRD